MEKKEYNKGYNLLVEAISKYELGNHRDIALETLSTYAHHMLLEYEQIDRAKGVLAAIHAYETMKCIPEKLPND